MATTGIADEATALVEDLEKRLLKALQEFRAYMASEEGQQLRKRLAQGAIVAAPLLFRLRFVRSSPVGRVLGLVGGAAILVKLAEMLRDWEPTIDLEPA